MDSLKDLVLKEIARHPSKHVNEISFKRAIAILPLNNQNTRVGHDKIVQNIIDYVITAGRLTDDIISISMLNMYCTNISFKNSKITSDYVMKVSHHCKLLKSIVLDGCLQVDDLSILTVLKNCPNMQQLSINNCRKITDNTLIAFKQMMENGYILQSLCIGGNFNITKLGLENFFQLNGSNSNYLKNITHVNIGGLTLSDMILKSMMKYCPNITQLGLSYTCSTVLHENMFNMLIKTYNKTLEHLEIAWLGCNSRSNVHMSGSTLMMTEFTSDALLLLVFECKLLKSVDICGMKCFSIPAIQRMIEYKANLVETQPRLIDSSGSFSDGYVAFTSINIK